jgi:hypothetical protein
VILEKMNHVKRNQMKFDNKNPGSELCTQLQGEVFIAFRGKKSQGFCRFNDLSIISLDAFLKIANI